MSWTEVGFYRLCTDWIRDPQRRRQVVVRYLIEGGAGAVVAVVLAIAVNSWVPAAAWVRTLAAIGAAWLVAPCAEFLVYEFILEPCGLIGPYWERTPAAGTTFTRW